MSRIAKIPVTIAKGVTVAITEADVTVKGPVGEVKMHILPLVKVTEENGHLHFEQLDESRDANMNVGTMRALVNDMVKGCSAGFEKRLTLVGVGFRAQAQGDKLNLQLGFSHPIVHHMSQTEIVIKGADKQKVGQTAAEIRAYRAPEPYKGKGVRYANEHVVIKETKKK